MLSHDAAGGFVYFEDSDSLFFYLRSPNPDIPHLPEVGKIGFFGGVIEEGESPLEAATREIREELVNADTGKQFEPGKLELFGVWIDDQGCRKYIHTCRVKGKPNLKLGPEGRGLMLLSRQEAMKAEFAFGYEPMVHAWLKANPARKQ